MVRKMLLVICLPFTITLLALPAQAVDREVGTGKTYPTIGDALAAAGPNDIILVFPGTYAESVDLNTMGTKGNITFRTVDAGGSPQAGTADVSPPAGPAFTHSGADFPGDVMLEGFEVTSPDTDGLRLWDINGDVMLANVTATNAKDDGIDLWQISGTVTLIGCVASNNGDDGFDIEEVTGKVTATNCTADGNGVVHAADGDGFEIIVASDVEITGCTAKMNSQEGIDVEEGNNVTIRACTSMGNGGEGIDTDKVIGDLIIEYCTVTDSGENGVTVAQNGVLGGSARVSCNIISGNHSGLMLGASAVVDAENNWWGDASGPSGPGFTGTGDSIAQGPGSVDADPWLTTANIDPSACPGSPAAPTPVPTMGQWGTVLLWALLGVCSLLAFRRRRNPV